jgi:site-specific recombinase XerD
MLATPGGSALVVRDELAGVGLVLPALVASSGRAAAHATLEFFAARLSNPHTRRAYLAALHRFGHWCDRRGLALDGLTPTRVAAYVADLESQLSLASLKLHAAALRHWLDYLTERGILGANPARSVRTPRLVVREGKTPVLERDEARRIFAELDRAARGPRPLLALRDRALLGVMLFGFVRVGAALRMRVRDFEGEGASASLVLHEKGGKERRIPCHHQARTYLREYIAAAGLEPMPIG